ncbi:uncharacterized protein LOC124253564 [Haliotis rubra]|uniref:uncharacterized protein LOC124253564 n=1 Tax=Haliotis rubra TaxID=36100 RepID=UPI001EE5BAA2|nr:uncharacterized protein LOC124253564 [Haliotis rubra]
MSSLLWTMVEQLHSEKGGISSLPEALDLSVSVDVTFTAPAITYKSCGMLYDRSPVNVTVDYRNMDLLSRGDSKLPTSQTGPPADWRSTPLRQEIHPDDARPDP